MWDNFCSQIKIILKISKKFENFAAFLNLSGIIYRNSDKTYSESEVIIMKKSIIAAGLAAALLTVSGCSAEYPAEIYKGTDIGGTGVKTNGGFFGDIADALAGGIRGDADMAAMDGMAFLETATAAAPEAGILPEPVTPTEKDPIDPQSGLLTGGEWNDNSHWEDWQDLYNTNDYWKDYQAAWKNTRSVRLAVTVLDEDKKPVEGAKVSSPNGGSAVTDNKGKAYLFYENSVDFEVQVTKDGYLGAGMNVDWVDPEKDNTLTVTMKPENDPPKSSKKLDLMIVCDTTGSMGDELEYLKVELADIVQKIKSDNANIPTRISVNFYRDTTDEYVVRSFPFSENINEVVKAIGEQSADGGGDTPEAVHSALQNAIDDHDWADESVKIMFLVLDAPPHDDVQIIDEVNKYIDKAAELGIRIIPVASSGIDKSTEYLLRVMAQATGGTYTFLTNDSGIGGDHIEATVGAYNVEKLNDMMVRIVNGYLD